MVLTAGALWAVNGTVSKLVLQAGFDAPQLTTLRATCAFASLLPISAMWRVGRRRGGRFLSRRAELPRLVVFGFTGLFVVPTLYFVSIHRLPVGIGVLFQYTAPVFTALWVRFGQRQHVRARLWLGLVLCLLGLAGVAEVWHGEIALDGLGIAAALGGAVLLAVYYVLGSKSVADRDPLSVTCWAFGVAAIAGALVRPWWNFPVDLLSGRTMDGVPIPLLLAYLNVGGTIAPYLLVITAMRHLPPTSMGIVGMIEPVLAGVAAWALLHEVLSVPQLVGGLVVLGGVILAETARVALPARSTTAAHAGHDEALNAGSDPRPDAATADDPRPEPSHTPATEL